VLFGGREINGKKKKMKKIESESFEYEEGFHDFIAKKCPGA
jgi:hypothetical protein